MRYIHISLFIDQPFRPEIALNNASTCVPAETYSDSVQNVFSADLSTVSATILVGEAPFLSRPLTAFVRLKKAQVRNFFKRIPSFFLKQSLIRYKCAFS